MKILKLSLLVLALHSTAYSQTFTLVKDIRPGGAPGILSGSEIVVWNNKIYFGGSDGTISGPYVSDGTATGTLLIKDLNNGGLGASHCMALINGQLVFWGRNDATVGIELFKSDGTDPGTILAKDINPGLLSSNGYTQAVLNGFKYFDANTALYDNELWRSDGTEAGTTLVKDINPIPGASGNPREIRRVGNLIFFYADDGMHGQEVWKSDGTESGTAITKDIFPGSGGSQDGLEFADFNGIAYFRKNDGVNGNELWRSDGTEAGTYMVKDINPGAGSSNAFNFIVFNNNLYFIASDNLSQKLWKTDGTAGGTVSLAEAGGTFFSYGNDPSRTMAECNGFLYFPGRDAATGLELWKTDGSLSGTSMVKDINPGAGSTAFRDFIKVNDRIIFNATTVTAGSEPWTSDGTSAGTYMLQDIEPGAGSSAAGQFVLAGTKLFAVRTTTSAGRELWVANDVVPLPLQFLSFTIQKCNTSRVCLAWKTAHEVNVSHFEVERSTDGVVYYAIARLTARNQSQNEYAYADDISSLRDKQQAYYRIRQVDQDGRYSYSPIERIGWQQASIDVYPALINTSLHVNNRTSQPGELLLFSADGRLLQRQKLAPGQNEVALTTSYRGMLLYNVMLHTQVLVQGKLIRF